jgi:hypothetical protein
LTVYVIYLNNAKFLWMAPIGIDCHLKPPRLITAKRILAKRRQIHHARGRSILNFHVTPQPVSESLRPPTYETPILSGNLLPSTAIISNIRVGSENLKPFQDSWITLQFSPHLVYMDSWCFGFGDRVPTIPTLN